MRKTCLLLLVLLQLRGFAQQALAVTDSTPVTLDGLNAGYTITETSEKEVGNKGNFSRYKLRFFVTNVSNEAKIMYQRPPSFGSNSYASNVIVRFRCANATGARLTNTTATMELEPCSIMADVEDKDCATGKTVKRHQLVNIGYWIRPGESITVNSIMITPLGEKPDMTVVYYPAQENETASIINNPNWPQQQEADFVRIRNFANNFYLHVENGPLTCTQAETGWRSAQWQILPVSGTSYYVIKNRWRENYIAADNFNAFTTDDSRNTNAMWTIEDNGSNGTYTIRNVGNKVKLVLQNNVLKISASPVNGPAMQWVIEHQ